ncbi:hypothetical protein ykris0001_7200 [Yersinia kristensenii ATCC 33638]|nr:hypothetical protein ykris0001_7200 [Yersinia kristensenii ATCC 33638]
MITRDWSPARRKSAITGRPFIILSYYRHNQTTSASKEKTLNQVD